MSALTQMQKLTRSLTNPNSITPCLREARCRVSDGRQEQEEKPELGKSETGETHGYREGRTPASQGDWLHARLGEDDDRDRLGSRRVEPKQYCPVPARGKVQG